MTTQLLTGDAVWRTISTLARHSHQAHVAVAWCASRVGRLLPLKPGSVLVTDLTEGAVRAGQTRPRELLPLLRAGVAIHSLRKLHAKVFVFDDTAVIGSSNVSANSAKELVEAAVLIRRDRRLLAEARQFVTDLAGDQVGEDELRRLEKLWRPPRVPGGSRSARPPREPPRIPRDPLWIFPLAEGPWEEEVQRADKVARPVAKKRMRSRLSHLTSFEWNLNRSSERLAPGQQVLQVVQTDTGTLVEPPGRITYLRRVRLRKGGAKLLVYVEEPRRVNRRALKRYARQVGSYGRGLQKFATASSERLVRDANEVQAHLQVWLKR